MTRDELIHMVARHHRHRELPVYVPKPKEKSMAKSKTLEQIEQEMRNIEWYYRQTKQEYHDWDLQDRMRYGTLMKMQLRRLEQQPTEDV